jgi:hypothetical protein
MIIDNSRISILEISLIFYQNSRKAILELSIIRIEMPIPELLQNYSSIGIVDDRGIIHKKVFFKRQTFLTTLLII